VLKQGKNLNIGEVIENDTHDLKQRKKNQEFRRTTYLITRIIIHASWTILQIFLLYHVVREHQCLVKWGYAQPYMFFPKDSDPYEEQMASFIGDPDLIARRTALLNSLGDLYDPKNEGKSFLWDWQFGPPGAETREDYWLNFSIALKVLCLGTLLFESLQVINFTLQLRGFKMKRGLGFCIKYALAISPVFGMILFFLETWLVFGFNGRTCFCNFK
jgi:hypothetical protein